jgi:hypothetical protein
MNDTVRQILIMVITLVILLAIFWFVLPMLGVADMVGGPGYFILSIVGSLALSLLLSRWLSSIIR